jgi:uncharacterized membrane protein YfcA
VVSAWGDAAIFGAGMLAGTINTIVGSGSLVTFPTLIGLGYPPLVANVSNTIGLVPGSVSGAIGYRRELEGQGRRALSLGAWALTGGLSGAVILLAAPGSFQEVVPWLVLLAVGMVIAQPRLSRRLASRGPRPHSGGWWLRVGVLATAVYGGYFGAAQGVLLIGLLGLSLDDHLQRLNALKNVLAALVNGVAAVYFMVRGPVAWVPAGLLAVASTLGGQVGARIGRRLPDPVLRAIIVVAGVTVAIKLLI